MSANLAVFSDRGIILAIEDNIGPDGYADVHDLADVLGMETARGLGMRLSWMSRYGMVEKHKEEAGRWRVVSRARKTIERAAEALDEIEAAARLKSATEFDLLRRTVEHHRRNRNGHRR